MVNFIDIPAPLHDDVAAYLAKPNATRDQRAAVYTYQRRGYMAPVWDTPLLTDELATLAAEVCDHFAVPHPPISIIRLRGTMAGICYHNHIELDPATGLNLGTLLHELAHWVINKWRESITINEPGHGPLFVRVFCHILGHFSDLDEATCVREAQASGIKVATTNMVARGDASKRCLHCGPTRGWGVRLDMHFCTFKCALRYAQAHGIVVYGTNQRTGAFYVEKLVAHLRWDSWSRTWGSGGEQWPRA